jgi:hypothetical protein
LLIHWQWLSISLLGRQMCFSAFNLKDISWGYDLQPVLLLSVIIRQEYLFDSKLSRWLYVMKSSWVMSHISMELVSDVLETVSVSVIWGWYDERCATTCIYIRKIYCQLSQHIPPRE